MEKNKNCCEMGTYECDIKLIPPKHFVIKKPIYVDKCLAPAIKALWKVGFKTIASCCGHKQTIGRIDFYNKRIKK